VFAWEGNKIEITPVLFSSPGRGNWPEFLRSKVKLERRPPGVKLAKGFFDGPGTAVLEGVFPETKGRKLRRVRREGNDVPPPDG
jgi:hypothetical protein